MTLTAYTIEAVIAQLPNPHIHEKPDILLISLSRQRPKPGDFFQLDYARDYPLACATDASEIQYYQKCLIERGDLASLPPGIIIKAQGWQRIAQLAAKEDVRINSGLWDLAAEVLAA